MRAGIVATTMLVALVVLGINLNSLALVLVGPVSYVVVHVYGLHREPLQPTSQSQVLATRPYAFAALLVAILLVTLALLYGHPIQ